MWAGVTRGCGSLWHCWAACGGLLQSCSDSQCLMQHHASDDCRSRMCNAHKALCSHCDAAHLQQTGVCWRLLSSRVHAACSPHSGCSASARVRCTRFAPRSFLEIEILFIAALFRFSDRNSCQLDNGEGYCRSTTGSTGQCIDEPAPKTGFACGCQKGYTWANGNCKCRLVVWGMDTQP